MRQNKTRRLTVRQKKRSNRRLVVFPLSHSRHNVALRNFILMKCGPFTDWKNACVLEVGCGNGRFGYLLGKSVGEYRGIDPVANYIKLANQKAAHQNTSYRVGRGERIPYTTKFDVILYPFSWHFLQHSTALREAKRVLKKGGIILIFEPGPHSGNWQDPRLQEGGREFDAESFHLKMEKIRQGQEALKRQSTFEVVKRGNNGFLTFWLLRKK